MFSLLELIIGQVLRGLHEAALVGWLVPDLEPVAEWLHDPSTRGLAWYAAIVVFAVGAVVTYALGGSRESFRERFAGLPDETRRRTGFIVAVVFIFIGFWMPTFVGGFVNEIFATVGLFLLMGLGLNVVVGLAGLLDLGYVAFFAVGAYTTAILMSPESPRITPEWPFWIVILIVIVAAVIAGIMVGTPVIRMRGDYLAIVTLGFGEIVRIMFLSDWTKPITGGAQGIINVPSIIISRGFAVVGMIVLTTGLLGYALWWARNNRSRLAGGEPDSPGAADRSNVLWRLGGFGITLFGAGFGLWFFAKDDGPIEILGTNTQAIVYLVLLFAILAAYISWRIQDSRIGRAWMAMREDEQVAEAMGINIVTAKLLAFITGAILASFGGALFAVKIGSIFPNSFALLVSIIVLVLIIVGGMGNIPGVAVGAVMLVGILGGPTQPGLLREFESYKLLIYGALLVWMMLKRPEGLLPSIRRTRELHQDEFLQDAWLRKQLDEEEAAAEGAG
jgi:branched-chain amino acid transport system permease protein